MKKSFCFVLFEIFIWRNIKKHLLINLIHFNKLAKILVNLCKISHSFGQLKQTNTIYIVKKCEYNFLSSM